MAPTIYKALSNAGHATRIVKLQPGQPDSPLVAELIIVDLSSKPKYEAISYAWGNDPWLRLILLNGQPHQISYNLFSCLKRLRVTENPRLLWVDALSIAQNDNNEKSQQ